MSDPLEELFSLPSSGKDFDLQAARLAIALMREGLKTLTKDHESLKQDIEKGYARKSEVTALEEKVKLPITMVYATAALMLIAVVGALVALVVKGHGS